MRIASPVVARPPPSIRAAPQIDAPASFRAPWFDRDSDSAQRQRRTLLRAQFFLIQCHIDLMERGLVCLASTEFRTNYALGEVRGHPVQDPTGSLFHALMLLRLVRPHNDSTRPAKSGEDGLHAHSKTARESPTSTMAGPDELDCGPPVEAQFTRKYRIVMAALLSVSHKFTTNAPPLKNVKLGAEWAKVFLKGLEKPRFSFELETLVRDLIANESVVVTKFSIWRLFATSPLAHAEDEFERMLKHNIINDDMLMCMRGCVFYFLGAALLNPVWDVLETLATQCSLQKIGRAVAYATFACAQVAFGLHRTCNDAEAIASYVSTLVCFLDNGLAPHAQWLRRLEDSPYALVAPSANRDTQGQMFVRKMVAPTTIRAARKIFMP